MRTVVEIKNGFGVVDTAYTWDCRWEVATQEITYDELKEWYAEAYEGFEDIEFGENAPADLEDLVNECASEYGCWDIVATRIRSEGKAWDIHERYVDLFQSR